MTRLDAVSVARRSEPWGERRRSPLLLGFLLLVVFGCSQPAEEPELGYSTQPVVYGEDDRLEYFESTDIELRRLTEQATVALLPQSALRIDAARGTLDGPAWRDQLQLCDGEPFADQPSLAQCTGVLVSEDLVLTAGHCVSLVPCEEMALVFGFYNEAENQLHPTRSADIALCAEVVTREVSPTDAADEVDYAWIRLQKPRPAGAAATLDPHPVAVDAAGLVHSVSFGGGIPAKIETGARIRDPRPETLDYFVTSLDNFHGGSGAAVYDSNYHVVGVAARGQPDFWLTDAGCRVSVREAESGAGEEITYAHRALEGLCKTLSNDHALCAGRAPAAEAGCSFHHGSRSRAAWVSAFLLLATSACRSGRRRTVRKCLRNGRGQR